MVELGDLLSRARAGDSDAFRDLTEPHRRELLVQCNRMLGSFQDAEDAMQETLLTAWRGLAGFEGRDLVARLCASIFRAGRRFDFVPRRANGQPAFGTYLRAPNGIRHGTGLYVLTLTGDRICALTRFESSTLASFGLPRSLPSR
jgi:hypothetical protein